MQIDNEVVSQGRYIHEHQEEIDSIVDGILKEASLEKARRTKPKDLGDQKYYPVFMVGVITLWSSLSDELTFGTALFWGLVAGSVYWLINYHHAKPRYYQNELDDIDCLAVEEINRSLTQYAERHVDLKLRGRHVECPKCAEAMQAAARNVYGVIGCAFCGRRV